MAQHRCGGLRRVTWTICWTFTLNHVVITSTLWASESVTIATVVVVVGVEWDQVCHTTKKDFYKQSICIGYFCILQDACDVHIIVSQLILSYMHKWYLSVILLFFLVIILYESEMIALIDCLISDSNWQVSLEWSVCSKQDLSSDWYFRIYVSSKCSTPTVWSLTKL